MEHRTLGLPWSLFLFSILAYAASGTQRCVPQAIPDMVIDIGQAVARGARFTDPVKVSSVEECLSACCRQMDAGGDRGCNLLVFDARRPGLQNCYIFHCPTLDSCPLSSSPGVLTYSFWSDSSRPGKDDPDQEQRRPQSGGRSRAQGSPKKTSGSGDKESGPPDNNKASRVIASKVSADTSKTITSQLLHLADKIDQHLEQMESKSEDNLGVPSSSPAIVPTLQTTTIPLRKEVKKLPSKASKPGKVKTKKPEALQTHPTEATKVTSDAPKRIPPRLGTAAPRLVPYKNPSHVAPPTATHDSSGIKKVPSSHVKSAKLPSTNHTAKKVGHTEVPALTTARQTRPPHIVSHAAPSWTSPWNSIYNSTKTSDQPSTSNEGEVTGRVLPETHPAAQKGPAVNLEEAPSKVGSAGSDGAFPPPEDKSGLVAALVFGLLFLTVVIGLVSRKVSEARRRHRYTKLDYLINGMYVDT
ncbi:MANSC domain-containing protein 1 isoform 2-T3 [Anomaloglossus baeobatrachus]